MALVIDNSAFGSATNRTEWGGVADGIPPLSDRLKQAASFGAYTPPAGCTVMQLVQVAPSDGPYFSSTGWRNLTREAQPVPYRTAGYEEWQVFAVLTPAGFPADANMWVSGFEMHQTDPGGGTGVAPSHCIFHGTGLSLDCYGGTTSASGGIGNPGRTTTYSNTFTAAKYTTRDKWHVCVVHYKHGIGSNGAYEFFHGLQGTDTSVASITGLHTGSTIYGSTSNYLLFGIYRSQSGSSTTTIYTAGWKSYSTQSEALSWANTMLGGGGGGGGGTDPPPPVPDPNPNPAFDLEPAGWLGGRYAVTGTTRLGSQVDKQRASKLVVAHTGTATGIGTVIEPVPGLAAESMRFGVWNDDGSGSDPAGGAPAAVGNAELVISPSSAVARYTVDFVTPLSVTSGQVFWIGMLNGGNANEAYIRAQTAAAEFRLMDTPYTSGIVAWDVGNDAVFDISMVLWLYGTQTTGSAPINLVAPSITGTPQVGQIIRLAYIGTWSYQMPIPVITWQRDNNGNGLWTSLYSELPQDWTQVAYVISTTDVGCRIRLLVAMTNAIGTGVAASNILGPITSASVGAGSTGRSVLAGHSTGSTRSLTSTRRPFEGGGG